MKLDRNAPKIGINPEFRHRVNQATQIVTNEFRQDFVFHRPIIFGFEQ
jgi:hypothetical protein